jgi:hypothetical protein
LSLKGFGVVEERGPVWQYFISFGIVDERESLWFDMLMFSKADEFIVAKEEISTW